MKYNTQHRLDLLNRILTGDGAAWPEFRRSFEPLIAACVRRALTRHGVSFALYEVEDLVADVWLLLLKDDMRKLRAFDPDRGTKLSSWLGLITVNHVVDKLRSNQRIAFVDLSQAVDIPAERSAEQQVEHRRELSMVVQALNQLKPKDRSFIMACVFDDRPTADMAEALSVSVNTIYSRKCKIRQKLLRLMDAHSMVN